MKKGILLFFLFSYLNAFSASGIFQTYAIVNVSGGGNAYYAGGINSDGASTWASQTFTTPTSLILNGGEIKTYKNSGSNVTGAKIYYRVYKDGATPGSFIELDLPYDSELGGGNQKWDEVAANVDVLAMANSNGTWKIEVYWKATSSDGDHYDSNSGNNFIASFTVTSLPVELTKFKATPQNNSIQLNWQTAMEQNNSHFEIEKSIDGKEFSNIGMIEGFGTTTDIQDYTFIDENPVHGQNYYRLKQVDFDGDFEYSEIVTAEFSKRNTASFYPNPTKDELTIESDISTTVNIQIYNLQGQLVKQFTDIQLDEQHQVNLSDLNSGIYQLQLTDANSFELLQQHRIIKQ